MSIIINKLANSITEYLNKNGQVSSDDQREIYCYGVELIISTTIGFILILVSGLLISDIISSIIFLIVFVVLRQHCGGYHANSYLKCNTVFVLTFLSTVMLTVFLEDMVTVWMMSLLFAFNILTMVIYAPVDSKNKRLSVDEKKKHRVISIAIASAIGILALILMLIEKHYAIIVMMTLIMVSALLLFQKLKENAYEKD